MDLIIYYWLRNCGYFFLYIIWHIDEKSIILNKNIHTEMLFIRRLFLDWIKANATIYDMRKYVSFKLLLLDFLKSLNNVNLSKIHFLSIWNDFNIFIQSHGDYFLDIYKYCMKKKLKRIIYKHRLVIFSIISVFLFYKWRKKRNDSIRHWLNYNSRRKKNINIDVALFNKLVLNEAKKYGDRYRQKIDVYTI